MEYFFVGVCSVPHMDEPAMLAVSPVSATKKRNRKARKNAEFNDFHVKYENCAKIWSNHVQENQTFEDIHQHIHQDVGITSLLSQQMTV